MKQYISFRNVLTQYYLFEISFQIFDLRVYEYSWISRIVASEGVRGCERTTAIKRRVPLWKTIIFMPRLGGAYCFRPVRSQRKSSCRSQRKSVDWGTMGPALGAAYECYAHISSSKNHCVVQYFTSQDGSLSIGKCFGGVILKM